MYVQYILFTLHTWENNKVDEHETPTFHAINVVVWQFWERTELSAAVFYSPQSARAPSVMLHTKTPRATTTSQWTATSRDIMTCHRSADPPLPPPEEQLSDTLGMISGLRLEKKEQTLYSPLTIRAVDHPQSSDEASVPRRNWFLLQMPPFKSTLPLCGLKWYMLHHDRLVLQTAGREGCGEEVWTVAPPVGLQLQSCPMGKHPKRLHGEKQ